MPGLLIDSIMAVGATKRKSGVTLVKPIVVGTYAFQFSVQEIGRRRSRNDNSTHQWTFLIRSPTGEDMSYFIRKVVVNLHSSFVNPTRTLDRPPYEVTECGWGEFEIVAKVHFIDSNERPVEVRHWLRLYPAEGDDSAHKSGAGNSCVVAETYDEVCFNDPTERMYEALVSGPLHPLMKHPLEQHFLERFEKEEYLAALTAAAASTNKSIAASRTKVVELTLEIEKLKELYYSVHEDKAAALLNREATNVPGHPPDQQPVVKKEVEATGRSLLPNTDA